MTILQIVPSSTPAWAVFADNDGNPAFEPVVCWACVEFPPKGEEIPRRAIVGISMGRGTKPADAMPNFVSFATSTDNPDQWNDACKTKRAGIVAAEAAQAKTGLYIPDGVKAVGWEKAQ